MRRLRAIFASIPLVIFACLSGQPSPDVEVPDAGFVDAKTSDSKNQDASKSDLVNLRDGGDPEVGSSTFARVYYRGTNLSSAEFGSATPGVLGVDYTYPSTTDVDYFYAKGIRFFRIPFCWERLQRSQLVPLYSTDIAKLKALVSYATGRGMTVAIEPQNFGRYYGQPVGGSVVPSSAFRDFWSRMASEFKDNQNVMFDLMNEPNTMPTEQWVSAANEAINGIRTSGVSNTILVPGNGWDGAWSWGDNWYGTSNSVALLEVTDKNVLFEAHQYLDSDASGSYATGCTSATAGPTKLQPFVDWLRTYGRKGIIGEFGAPNTPTCKTATLNMLDYMEANNDVLAGWVWWSGGSWWGDYLLNLSPNTKGVESPMLSWLTPYLQH